MKRFLTTSFIALALVIGAMGVAPVAHATAQDTVGGAVDPFANAAVSAAVQTAAANTPTDYKQTSTDTAFNPVMSAIAGLFAWLVGVAALTLDYAVYYTVVSMGSYVSKLTAIGVTWRILRDIGNIALIFGFLAIGISTILNTGWYGGGKKMLPMLLVAAVFLNFSLFFSEAIIDTGNLFATQFYKQINGGNLPQVNASGFIAGTDGSAMINGKEGISTRLMSQLGLQSMYGDAINNKTLLQGSNPWYVGFMAALLFLITAFVMFSLAFILITRFVYLIFLIILAPLGFAGFAIPQLKGLADWWGHGLINQTITAPVLLLLLYVALAVITDAQFLVGLGAGSAGAATGFVGNANLPGFASYMISFAIAIGLMLAVTVSAKSLSAKGAGWATETAGKLTFGLTAVGLRSTAGWGATRAAAGWRKTALSRAPVIGRAVSGVLDRGAKGSFDVRASGAAAALNKVGFGLAAGGAAKGGFQGREKVQIKEREDYAKDLEQTTGKFLGIKYGVGEVEKQKEAEVAKTAAEQKIKEMESQNVRAVQVLSGKHKVEIEHHNDEVEKAQKNLAKLEDDQRKGGNVSAEELTAARGALTAARTAREQKVTEQSVEKEELKKTNEQLIKVQQTEVTEQQKSVDALKNAGKEGYARGLEVYSKDKEGKDKEGLLWGAVRLANPQRNTKAAENIRKEAKKSKTDKDLEILKKALEEGSKPKEEKPAEAPKPEAIHPPEH